MIAAPPALLARVLLPLDEALIARVSPLARAASSELLLLHVVPFLETLFDLPQDLAPGLSQNDLEPAAAHVDAVVRRLRQDGLDARGLARLGPAASALVDVAVAERATLIALPPGRLASRVLRLSPIPCLLWP